MKTFSMKILALLILSALSSGLSAQTYSNLDKTKVDSSEYKYLLPIWGKKTHALGFDLPYSAGIGINYLWQKSDIVISV